MLQPIVYLPLEIKNRELEARLLIACRLLERGVTVVFGQQWAIFYNVENWPPGAVLFKTMNQIQAANMEAFNKREHVVAGTDEEVLTSVSDFVISFSNTAAHAAHLFFAQSGLHAAAVAQRFPVLKERTVVTGNPRVDVIRHLGPSIFGEEAARIRKEMGPYVLVNSNYATINSIWGRENAISACIQAGVLDPDDPVSAKRFADAEAWEEQNFADMKEFVSWAAR